MANDQSVQSALVGSCSRLPDHPQPPRDYRERYHELTGYSLDVWPAYGGRMQEPRLLPGRHSRRARSDVTQPTSQNPYRQRPIPGQTSMIYYHATPDNISFATRSVMVMWLACVLEEITTMALDVAPPRQHPTTAELHYLIRTAEKPTR
jgi:hypothetical protein